MTGTEFSRLIENYRHGLLVSNEMEQLQQAIASGEFDHLLQDDIRMIMEKGAIHPLWTAQRSEAIWSAIDEEIAEKMTLEPLHHSGRHFPRTIRLAFRQRWFRYAAAILILIIGSVAYLWNIQRNSPRETAQTSPVPVQNDVAAPKSANAIITLANGQQIILDSASNGTLAREGNVRLVKLADGKIAYTGKSDEMQFNTLTNPRGSRVVNLTLADGSQVWLNAESSIHYPTSFTGNGRQVEITGEAYFEVAKDPKKKFIVSSCGMTTEVLGTHFNINAYDDEAVKQVTLLQGSIRVNQSGKQVMVKPGDQAVISGDIININKSIEVEKVMAWKNGLFDFDNKTLDESLKQLARWYDVNIIYEGKQPSVKLAGSIGRSLTLSQVLKGLSAMELKTRLDASGKKLIILE